MGEPGKWDHMRSREKPEGEYKEAIRDVKAITKPSKRRPSGKSNLPPLNGATQQTSDLIREATALEFAGYSQGKIAEILGYSQSKVCSALRDYPKAVEEARKEIVSEANRRYWQNLIIIKTAVTEAGPRAIRTLIEVMDSPKAAPNHRISAATNILKLINVDDTMNANEEAVNPIVDEVRAALKEKEAENIVDAESVEDAEVVEDGENRDPANAE